MGKILVGYEYTTSAEWRKTMIRVISLLFIVFSAVEIQGQYVDILDLTIGDRIISEMQKRWGSGSGGSSSRPIVSVMLKLDKDRYVVGEEFIYEISVRNISGEEIRIPWDTDGDKINNGNESYSYEDLPAGFIEVYTGIKYPNHIKKDDYTYVGPSPGIVALYGSDAYTSSIKTLKPEESVMIRATGRWNRDFVKWTIYDRIEDSSIVILEICAIWDFAHGIDGGKYHQITYSIPIQIKIEIPPDEETER